MKANEIKEWLSAEEFATRVGISVGYVREQCIIGQADKENGIAAQKVGKSWKIPSSEVERKLGIKKSDGDYKKEIYIRELESRIKTYEIQFNTVKNLVGTIETLVSVK